MHTRLDSLIVVVDSNFKRAERIYRESKKAAEEIAASASASPSQSGDRFHSQGSADLAKQKYEAVLALKEELKKKGDAICVEYNGETLYLVDNLIMVPGFKLVSTKAPLGQKILNEK